MKQLSSAELNSMSREDLAAMVLQMQQQIHTLNEKIAIMNPGISAAPQRNWRPCPVR